MHQRKYFNSNFFINEIFSVEKVPNYGNSQLYKHNPQPNSIYITQNKCHHIKSDTKMALRNPNS